MRVALDVSYARRGPSGTAVYLERLAQSLRAEGVEVLELADERRRPPAGGGLGSARNLARDAWWVQRELPGRARRLRADVLHHPLPALARRTTIPQVVTVHDLAFVRHPELFDPLWRRWAAGAHRTAARRAAAVIAVSRTTARDVVELWGVDPAKVVVARHGPGQGLRAPQTEVAEHFLYVGDAEPRKSLPLLLDAHALYRYEGGSLPLVLAGSGLPEQPGVRVVDRPSADELARLYAGAAALVHPSVHEGFGLTLLEAMTAGVPVVAARAPGVHETCGDAAEYAQTADAEGLARCLLRLGGDPALRRDLGERGRRRAASFSWRRSAREHVRAYTLACSP